MKKTKLILVLAGAILLAPVSEPDGRQRSADPLVIARAVADHELFGRIFEDDSARPLPRVHHNWFWEDATLMEGVFALYERLEEVGRPAPCYLEYLEVWGAHDPGGYPFPIFHGDAVAAGQTYIWLYERSGRSSDHLQKTDGMIKFIFKGRKPNQWGTGYNDYWMRFWQDDVHMIAPFLAMRGRAAGNQGIPDGKDAREIAMIYCRAYDDILGDPETGLFWHNTRALGKYHWGRGNGWVAAGYFKVMEALELDPAYKEDARWLRGKLEKMAQTLKEYRNPVGTWCADITNCEEYPAPETSASAFFVYMIAGMINRGYLGEDYFPVVQKAWNFLRLSVTDEGKLMRVQPVGRGPVKKDFETNSESYGVGAFLLAAVEMSKLPAVVLDTAAEVECIHLPGRLLKEQVVDDGEVRIPLDLLLKLRPDFPVDSCGRSRLVAAGRKLPSTTCDRDRGFILVSGLSDWEADQDFYLFYQP